MATLLGTDTYQGQISPIQTARAKGSAVSGDIREFTGKYVCTAAAPEATGCQLPIVKLPLGAKLRSLVVNTNGVGGTSVVIDTIGDAGNASRYSTADIALTAANTTSELQMTMLGTNGVDPFVIDTDANSVILATLTGTFPLTKDRVITFRGTYLLP